MTTNVPYKSIMKQLWKCTFGKKKKRRMKVHEVHVRTIPRTLFFFLSCCMILEHVTVQIQIITRLALNT